MERPGVADRRSRHDLQRPRGQPPRPDRDHPEASPDPHRDGGDRAPHGRFMPGVACSPRPAIRRLRVAVSAPTPAQIVERAPTDNVKPALWCPPSGERRRQAATKPRDHGQGRCRSPPAAPSRQAHRRSPSRRRSRPPRPRPSRRLQRAPTTSGSRPSGSTGACMASRAPGPRSPTTSPTAGAAPARTTSTCWAMPTACSSRSTTRTTTASSRRA